MDAGYAPVGVGDLLTTSPTAGHAMRAEDPVRAFGATIGKALRKDDERRKATYPRLVGLAESEVRAQAAVTAGISALDPLGEGGTVLRHLAQFIIARES